MPLLNRVCEIFRATEHYAPVARVQREDSTAAADSPSFHTPCGTLLNRVKPFVSDRFGIRFQHGVRPLRQRERDRAIARPCFQRSEAAKKRYAAVASARVNVTVEIYNTNAP